MHPQSNTWLEQGTLKRRIVGVLGGMGPAATVDFLSKIVSATPAANDQEHVPLIVYSVPQVPDRTLAILRRDDAPFGPMLVGARNLQASGADVIAIPCNAAHAWHKRLSAELDVDVLHIADEAARALSESAPDARRVALLAVRGTILAHIYQDRLPRCGPELVIPDERQQVAVDRAVRAVKAGTLREARGIASELGKMYERLGIDALLLACTELPIAFAGVSTELSLVDPTEALARACVAFSLARIGRNAFESK